MRVPQSQTCPVCADVTTSKSHCSQGLADCFPRALAYLALNLDDLGPLLQDETAAWASAMRGCLGQSGLIETQKVPSRGIGSSAVFPQRSCFLKQTFPLGDSGLFLHC